MLSAGTKWPSMMSTWMVRAPASSTSADLLGQAAEVRGEDRRRDAVRAAHGAQMGCSIELRQWLQAYSAVLDMRTIVECSPQFGHTDASSKRRRQFTQR